MKQTQISLLLILLLINTNCEIQKKKQQRRQLMYQYLLMAAGTLITGYFTQKYVKNYKKQNQLLNWENDKNWEDRFFNLFKDQGITLQYIRIIIDNFASTILNQCIKNFKIEKENAEKDPNFIEAFNKVNELNLYLIENYMEDDEEWDEEYQQKFNELQEQHQIIDRTQLKFEKQTQHCLDFYHFQSKYSFLSKFMGDLKYTMTYFKLLNSDKQFDKFLTLEEGELPEEQKQELLLKEQNLFKDFLKQMTELIESNEEWSQINDQFKTTFYTIHNIFTKQGQNSIELTRKQLIQLQ